MIFPGLCLWEVSLWPPLRGARLFSPLDTDTGSGALALLTNPTAKPPQEVLPDCLLQPEEAGRSRGGGGRVRGRPTGWAAPH